MNLASSKSHLQSWYVGQIEVTEDWIVIWLVLLLGVVACCFQCWLFQQEKKRSLSCHKAQHQLRRTTGLEMYIPGEQETWHCSNCHRTTECSENYSIFYCDICQVRICFACKHLRKSENNNIRTDSDVSWVQRTANRSRSLPM